MNVQYPHKRKPHSSLHTILESLTVWANWRQGCWCRCWVHGVNLVQTRQTIGTASAGSPAGWDKGQKGTVPWSTMGVGLCSGWGTVGLFGQCLAARQYGVSDETPELALGLWFGLQLRLHNSYRDISGWILLYQLRSRLRLW